MKMVRLLRILAIAGVVFVQLATLRVLPLSADIPEKFTNLKVMPKEISKEDLLAAMRSYSASLGVRCNFCHVRPEGNPQSEFDFAADDKPQKQTARVMMQMTERINAVEIPKITTEHLDRVDVTCRTCHHGQARPWLVEDVLSGAYKAGGVDSLATRYEELRKQYYGTDSYNFGEHMLLSLAEKLAGQDDPGVTAKLAEYNLRWFPESGYTYLVLGQAHATMGDTDAAIKNLKKAIELNQDLKENAQRLLDRLETNRRGTNIVLIRWGLIAVIVSLAAAVLGGAHYYVYARLLHALGGLRGGWLWTVRVAAVALALSFPLTHILARTSAGPVGSAANWIAAVWLGLFLYLFLFTLLLHAVTVAARLSGLWPHLAPLLGPYAGRGAVLAVSGIALAIGGYGIYQARCGIVTTRIEARMKNLPAGLDGFSIVQISDVHVGAIIGSERLTSIVERVNDLRPDLIVVTGDLVDEEAADLANLAPALGELRATHGVLAVAGNHDVMAGLDAVVSAAMAGGVRFLRNEKTLVADTILVYGIDDPAAGRSHGGPVSFDRVIGPEAMTQPAILLYHRPLQPSTAAALGIDLMLSGHTHRGQIWPLSYVSRLFFPYQSGRYRIDDTLLYVSRGIGTWGPPMRVASPPEIVQITLRAGRAAAVPVPPRPGA